LESTQFILHLYDSSIGDGLPEEYAFKGGFEEVLLKATF